MTIAKPLQVVCSPPKSTSIFRPRLAYFQWRFVPMCPSSVFFSFFLSYFIFYFFTSVNTMLTRNLSYKNIPNVFSGFSGGPQQLPNHYKWCALLPKSQASSDHRLIIFKDVSLQCALRQCFFYFSQQRVVQKCELSKYSKSFVRFLWRPTTIAKPLPVVCSPPAITSNVRPKVVNFQRRFEPMCPSSVFFFIF